MTVRGQRGFPVPSGKHPEHLTIHPKILSPVNLLSSHTELKISDKLWGVRFTLSENAVLQTKTGCRERPTPKGHMRNESIQTAVLDRSRCGAGGRSGWLRGLPGGGGMGACEEAFQRDGTDRGDSFKSLHTRWNSQNCAPKDRRQLSCAIIFKVE